MNFTGLDLVLATPAADQTIRTTLAAVFRVDPDRISIIEGVEHYPERGDVDIVCVRSNLPNDFPMLLSIDTDGIVVEHADLRDFARDVVTRLSTTCLIADDSVDPYTMWHVSSDGAKRVCLDTDAFETGRYVVAGVKE